VDGNIDQLKALFPEACTEGKTDFEVLKQLLGGAVDEGGRGCSKLLRVIASGAITVCRMKSGKRWPVASITRPARWQARARRPVAAPSAS